MKKTQNTLMALYLGFITLAVLIVVLCETDIIPYGYQAGDKQSEFFVTIILELATMGGAFLGLRLFRFRQIHEELITRKSPALLKYGVARLLLIALPMLCNTFLYYIYMNPTFGYLAIMLFLCLPFVYPSMNRCMSETTDE